MFERFNTAFWDDELGFSAYALDGDKRKVLSVASNPGHCLWSEIVPGARAQKVVARLMAPDIWSGWAVHTLSATDKAFNPYNYQTGTVWPHDNAIIAMGFKQFARFIVLCIDPWRSMPLDFDIVSAHIRGWASENQAAQAV